MVCFIVGLELLNSLHWSVRYTRNVPLSITADCAGALVVDGERETFDFAGTLLEVSVSGGRIVIDECDVLVWLSESLLSVTKEGNSSKSVTGLVGEAGVCNFLRSRLDPISD